ncbi:MAG: glycosyltransferase family 1 protein, partial [Aquificaceae bacterium]|nr:glycosyltransferase family 1 protein [Aquificaceae bacterium]
MKIAFLRQGEDLGINRHFLSFVKLFRQKGVEVREFDLSSGDLQSVVNELLEFSPIFSLDFNG